MPTATAARAHHELAAVVEFIHTATLLHDDVVDESSMRRGRQTANALFGNAASVLVGDFLYSRSFQMMVGLDNMRVMQILSDATNVIAEGEVLQLLNMHDPDVSQESYLKVIRSKTAKLFEAAAELGALISGATDAQIDAAGEYGRSLGTAFQLIDDVLDYAGDAAEIGKNVGDDLREGKPTLPLIYLMETRHAGTARTGAQLHRARRRAAFRRHPGRHHHQRRARLHPARSGSGRPARRRRDRRPARQRVQTKPAAALHLRC